MITFVFIFDLVFTQEWKICEQPSYEKPVKTPHKVNYQDIWIPLNDNIALRKITSLKNVSSGYRYYFYGVFLWSLLWCWVDGNHLVVVMVAAIWAQGSFSSADLALCSPHLRRLLSPQRDLRGHDALPLHHQKAAGAATVPPAAEAFVAFQAGNDSVVPTAGAFWAPGHLAWLLLVALWRQRRFPLPSVPAAAALPGASVRNCHVRKFLGLEYINFCSGLQPWASFQMRRHLGLRTLGSHY